MGHSMTHRIFCSKCIFGNFGIKRVELAGKLNDITLQNLLD